MNTYCPYCMSLVTPGRNCPSCGRDPSGSRPSSHPFPPGTLLRERYLVGRALGEGGFGITYLGMDTSLERKVAIKEYFPTSFVKREASISLDVTCYTDVGRNYYEKGRDEFLKEARTMARLDKIPGIVRVLDYFPENNTAYIVMEYLEGSTLKELTAKEGRIPADTMFALLEPVLKAMDAMHRAGVIHRDISPDNLMVLKDGTVTLMDFGCARDLGGGHTMTVTLKHGFAPMEQYSGHGQGPWTDLYALCATVYYCLTGKIPARAVERMDTKQDPLQPPTKLGAELTLRQERTLMRGLKVRAEDRPQSAAELYAALYGRTITGEPVEEPEEIDPDPIDPIVIEEEKRQEEIGKTEAVDQSGAEDKKQKKAPEKKAAAANSEEPGETEYIGDLSGKTSRTGQTDPINQTVHFDSRETSEHDEETRKTGASKAAAWLRSIPLAAKAGAGAVVCAVAVLALVLFLNGGNTPAGNAPAGPGSVQQNESQSVSQDIASADGDMTEDEENLTQGESSGAVGESAAGESATEQDPTDQSSTDLNPAGNDTEGTSGSEEAESVTEETTESTTERRTEATTEPTTERRTEATTEPTTERRTEATTEPPVEEPEGPSGSCGESVTWVLADGVLTISGNGRMDDYEDGSETPWAEYAGEIEEVIVRDGVTSIGDCVFDGLYAEFPNLTSVSLPETLERIGESAFRYAGIQSITIPYGVAVIEDQAFYGTNLTSVRIPSSVVSIGTEVFASCYELREFVVDENNPSYQSVDGVLFNAGGYRLISYPAGKADTEYTVPSSVNVIGFDAFWGKWNLERLYIPDTVTEMEDNCIGMNFNLTVCGSAGGIAEQYVTDFNEWSPGALKFEAVD